MKRILFVDDEPALLAGLELHLHRNYQIVTASCGHEGLTAVTENGPFQVVLSENPAAHRSSL